MFQIPQKESQQETDSGHMLVIFAVGLGSIISHKSTTNNNNHPFVNNQLPWF
jgi:hypothetical protein